MQIIQAPHAILSEKAKKIHKIDKDVLQLIAEMKTILVNASDPEGVGLAAPQVGKSLQLFIAKPTKNTPFSVFVNPQITLLDKNEKTKTKYPSKKKQTKLEGCLSLKDIWGQVHRANRIKAHYLDEHGTAHNIIVSGFLATIMQHEQDHLDGILFPKRVLEQNNKLYRSHKDDKGEDVFDEIKL